MSRAQAVIVDGKIITRRQITEDDLLAVDRARQELAAGKALVEKLRQRAEELEDDIMLRLKAKARVVGGLKPVIVREIGPRRPPWKDLYLDHLEALHKTDRAAFEKATIEAYPGQPRDTLVIFTRPTRTH
jgi:hypothetical protein